MLHFCSSVFFPCFLFSFLYSILPISFFLCSICFIFLYHFCVFVLFSSFFPSVCILLLFRLFLLFLSIWFLNFWFHFGVLLMGWLFPCFVFSLFLFVFLFFVCVCGIFGLFVFIWFFPVFSLFFPFIAKPCGLQGLGSQSGCQAWASGEVMLSPGCWNAREFPVPGNIKQQELSWRSPSHLQDLAPPNCLQAPVLNTPCQTTSKTRKQTHPSADRLPKVVLSPQTP